VRAEPSVRSCVGFFLRNHSLFFQSQEIYQKIEDIFKLARKGQDAFFRDCPKAVADAMRLLTMKGRDAGLATVATKAMSLKARYYSKKEEATPTEEGNLARGTMVRVKRATGNKELLYYRVLAVFRLYNKKWFVLKPSDLPVSWKKNPEKKIKTRLLVQMLHEEMRGTTHTYTPIRKHTDYSIKDIYRIIEMEEVQVIAGELELHNS